MIQKLLLTAALCASTVFSSACAQEASPETTLLDVAPMVAQAVSAQSFAAPDNAWLTPDQDNLLYITTDYGLIIVQLATDIAPRHTTQIKALTREGFYDYITFHRVIDGFMNQTGDPTGTGMGDSDLPNIEAEFTFRRDPAMAMSLLGRRAISASDPNKQIDVGYLNGFPIATQPSAQAFMTEDQKVTAWGLHCPGTTSMARSNNPNSGNSQFFLMRSKLPSDNNPVSHLDTQYSFWGATVYGLEHVDKIKVGTKGEQIGFVPDQMRKVRIGSDLPASEQVNLQVLKTTGPHFARFIETQKTASGAYKDICKITLPTRIAP